MELPVVSSLEFEEVRDSIKNFIKNKTDFQDYDFEGSNLSMLIDILSYNTLYTTYNVNMASNELNLDTAVLRDNIVSISKRLGYTPSSYTSSRVKMDVNLSGVSSYDVVRLKKGAALSASSNNKNYTFILTEDVDISVKNRSNISFENIEVVEGTEFVISYTVDESNEHQRFFIPNNFIDSETVRVSVISDPTNTQEIEYTRKDTIVDVSNSDTVFFVEEVQDQKYEIVFGDDVLGRKVRDGEVIKIKYVITSGGEANNISNFKFIGRAEGLNAEGGGGPVTLGYNSLTWSISDKTPRSDGGSEFESSRSIKFRAPRYYASQERAVTLADYESLIAKIYPNTDLVKVIAGETLSAPQFGKVFIVIKPSIGEAVSTSEKLRIQKELVKYKVGSVDVRILDAKGIDFVITPKIIFDTTKTRNRETQLKSLVNDYIADFIKKIGFNSFGGAFSDLSLRCGLKGLDPAITFVGNDLYLRQNVKLTPSISENYVTEFFTKLRSDVEGEFYALSQYFCHKGVASPVFLASKTKELIDDCSVDKNIYLVTEGGVVLKIVGTINIETGTLTYTVQACDGSSQDINILVVPDVLDVVVGPDVVPNLDLEDIEVYEDITDPNELATILDPGSISLPDINPGDTSGDTNIVVNPPPLITPGPGGGTVIIPDLPSIIDDETGLPSTDPVITDPNDVTTIEDYIPETNPYLCSWDT